MPVKGLIRISLLALIWGSGFLLIKIALRGFSPVQLTFSRLALGALVLLIFVAVTRLRLPHRGRTWLHLVMAALLANAIPYTLFGVAERHVDSSPAGVINATTPLWTVLFALATRTESRLTPRRWLGMLLGFAGVVVIMSPWNASQTSLGSALACLAATASYGAGYVYMARYLIGKGLSPLVLSASQLIAASGLLILATPFGGLDTPHWRLDAVVGLLALGAVGTGFAYVLNYRIITDDGPVLASTVTYLMPFVAVVVGALFLKEDLTPTLIAGTAVVLAGVALTRQKTSPAVARPAPASPK